jgi:hypothetical protein
MSITIAVPGPKISFQFRLFPLAPAPILSHTHIRPTLAPCVRTPPPPLGLAPSPLPVLHASSLSHPVAAATASLPFEASRSAVLLASCTPLPCLPRAGAIVVAWSTSRRHRPWCGDGQIHVGKARSVYGCCSPRVGRRRCSARWRSSRTSARSRWHGRRQGQE